MTDVEAIRKAVIMLNCDPQSYDPFLSHLEIIQILLEVLNAIEARDEKIAELEKDINQLKDQ